MKKDINYLDYIPMINKEYEWTISEDGIVIIKVINKGLFNKIAQTFFNRPKTSEISLDRYGSIVFKCIDGKSTIGEIADKVRNDFDDDNDDSFYQRLVKFFAILKQNKFIKYKNDVCTK